MRGGVLEFSAPSLDWPTRCGPFQLVVGRRLKRHDELFHG
jgi:hypothetical protein